MQIIIHLVGNNHPVVMVVVAAAVKAVAEVPDNMDVAFVATMVAVTAAAEVVVVLTVELVVPEDSAVAVALVYMEETQLVHMPNLHSPVVQLEPEVLAEMEDSVNLAEQEVSVIQTVVEKLAAVVAAETEVPVAPVAKVVMEPMGYLPELGSITMQQQTHLPIMVEHNQP